MSLPSRLLHGPDNDRSWDKLCGANASRHNSSIEPDYDVSVRDVPCADHGGRGTIFAWEGVAYPNLLTVPDYSIRRPALGGQAKGLYGFVERLSRTVVLNLKSVSHGSIRRLSGLGKLCDQDLPRAYHDSNYHFCQFVPTLDLR
jgi:hypothetical protein